MYELYPYFTNDGSVGLFSPQDDDIYHSTYGALSESWEKFILPSGLKEFLKNNSQVKILDICYGIGYNSKTALQVFINNYLNENSKMNNKKYFFSKIFSKNCHSKTHNIEAIHTDNISCENIGLENQNFINNTSINNEAIDGDNISNENLKQKVEINEKIVQNEVSNKILIDAVDLDKVLINISPFIKGASKWNDLCNNSSNLSVKNKLKYKQIKDLKKHKLTLKKEYKLTKEVSIILLEKILELNPELLNDKILQIILSNKKYSPFISKFMSNLANFYSNQGYKSNLNSNKMTFLHNIYYQYISKSYKNTKKMLKNAQFDINIHHSDARSFIKASKTKYDFIFLDAFTPAKCPALWSLEFIKELYDKLEDNGVLLTYSNSAAVRNALIQSGFSVGKTYNSNLNKFIGTVACKNESLIRHKLDNKDLDLINSKAGICFKDPNLNLDNDTIIKNRELEMQDSALQPSSRIIKGYKNAEAKSL